MKALRKYSHIGLVASVTIGVALAILLCVQCVRTYFYVGRVLVPQEAEHEAERQDGAITSAARTLGVLDPHALEPLLWRAVDDGSGGIVWMRLLTQENEVLSQAGKPQGKAKVPDNWWLRVEKHESLGRLIETPQGQAWVVMLPFRMPRRQGLGRPESPVPPGASDERPRPIDRRTSGHALRFRNIP